MKSSQRKLYAVLVAVRDDGPMVEVAVDTDRCRMIALAQSIVKHPGPRVYAVSVIDRVAWQEEEFSWTPEWLCWHRFAKPDPDLHVDDADWFTGWMVRQGREEPVWVPGICPIGCTCLAERRAEGSDETGRDSCR